MRILIRHLNPGDQIQIADQPHTVSSVATDSGSVRLYVVGDPHTPYVLPDSALVTFATA